MRYLTIEPTEDNLTYLGANRESYHCRVKIGGRYYHAESIRPLPRGWVGIYLPEHNGEHRVEVSDIEELAVFFNYPRKDNPPCV